MRRVLLLALLLPAVLAAPATAAEPALVGDDACDDSDTRVLGSPGPTLRVVLGDGEHDLRRTTLRAVPGGVDVVMTLCGQVPAPSLVSRFWTTRATTPDGRELVVSLSDFEGLRTGYVGNERHGFTVRGDTIVFEVRRAALLPKTAADLAPGTTFEALRTTTADLRTVVADRPDEGLHAATPGEQDELRGAGQLVL